MLYHSQEQLAAIIRLEQKCNQFEPIHIKTGIEHLTKKDGDHALLYYHGEHLTGLLSWHVTDGNTAQIHAMVHPEHRRQGVFRSLLQRAVKDIEPLGIQRLSFRIPQGSLAGTKAALTMGAIFDRSEYAMTFSNTVLPSPDPSGVCLIPALPQDFEFMVACSSQAFGESEIWTRDYFSQTNEPSRATFVAWAENIRVGLIRVNHVNTVTAFIHDFCILPSHQGKGLGQQVLMLAVEQLFHQSIPHIRLSVVTENERALHLYRNAGFEVTSEYQYYLLNSVRG